MVFATDWIKTGAVHDFVFIGKDVIATASGNHVIFYNLSTKEEKIEYFNSSARGEGACCLAGHPIVPMFSTAERCCSPKIYIHTYPDIRRIAVCKVDKGPNAYLSCCFAGTEYLISLTSFPHFKLIVWLWRTGEKMTSTYTMIMEPIQTIEASANLSHLVYQFSPVIGKVQTYEIYTYSKKVTITKNRLKSIEQQIKSVCWTNNGNLLLCDEFRNVYIISGDTKKSQLVLNGNSNISTENQIFVLPFLSGFVVVDNDSQLTYYNKSFLESNLIETWNAAWFIKCTSHPLKMVLARHKEAILLYGKNGKIAELRLGHENKPEFEEIFDNCQKFQLMCLIKPQDTHCALIDNSNSLIILNIFNGSINATVDIDQEDQVLGLAAHPSIPVLAVNTSSGKLICFIASTIKLKILKSIHLQRQALEKINFSKNGTALGVLSVNSKNVFLIKTIINKDINVFLHMKLKHSPIDFLIYEFNETLQLILLIRTYSTMMIGNCIEIYTINESTNSFSKTQKLYMHDYYQNLEYGLENVCDFLGTPYLFREIHLFKIENDYNSIVLVNIIICEHKLRKFKINISKNHILTSGFDGLVILRNNAEVSKAINAVMIHHYQEKGTQDSILSICGRVMVSLGRNGSLIGLKFREAKQFLESKGTIKIITWKCTDPNLGTAENLTWLEQEELKIFEKETNEMLAVRNIVLTDLSKLKTKIKRLLDLNKMKSKEAYLPISTFDLNSEKRKEKINNALHKQEEKKISLQNKIDETEQIINYLMHKFWDSMEIHSCTLVSFNSKTYVNNFSLCCLVSPEKMDDFSIELFNTPFANESTKLSDNVENQLHSESPTTIEVLNNTCNKIDNYLYLKYDNDIVFTGSTCFQWIKDDVAQNQLAKTDFNNLNYDVTTSRENKLKVCFNKRFDEMKCLKNNVLKETTKRLQSLTRYKNELQNVFGIISEENKLTTIKWQSVETPENIITIKEEDITPELSTIACVSNEEKETTKQVENIPKHVIEFRKEKLKEIMDGVLEIRWEDEIKKDIPKPDCLLLKAPSKYDAEDIKAVKIYKQKVEKLQAERQKYKSYLETEIQKINDRIQADIKDFDKKMEDFALEKIKIQSAILQEFLLRLTDRKSQALKDYGNRKIFFLKNNDLVFLENENKALIIEVSNIETIVSELKNRYENLNKRDKALEAKFRGEFEEMKQPLVEHMLRQYKRRPRIAQIACTSLTYLTETNKCLMAGKKSAILPREYLDFLRGMDALDVMPSSLPPQIEASHWQLLCKLRRNKVEMEIKLRIAAVELAEAEQTLLYMQKLSTSTQSKMYAMKNNLEEETSRQSKALQNPDIQLVLKAAQIEIVLSGEASNFDNTTIVTYDQLIRVNNKILNEGEKKIAAMRALMVLKKSILFRGWKYQCMVKKLKHWKEHLTVLLKTKIGKEMQIFLVERIEGKIRFKDSTSSNRMLKSVQRKFQRMLREERTGLLRVIDEIKYWHKMNAKLITKIELFSLKKQEQSSNLEEDRLRRRNRLFHKNHLRSIMERTRLVERVKESRDELLNLQTELELLKLKTYPTLRLKDSKRSSYFVLKNI